MNRHLSRTEARELRECTVAELETIVDELDDKIDGARARAARRILAQRRDEDYFALAGDYQMGDDGDDDEEDDEVDPRDYCNPASGCFHTPRAPGAE